MSEESRIWLQTIYDALPTDKKSLIAANLEALVKDVKPAVFSRSSGWRCASTRGSLTIHDGRSALSVR